MAVERVSQIRFPAKLSLSLGAHALSTFQLQVSLASALLLTCIIWFGLYRASKFRRVALQTSPLNRCSPNKQDETRIEPLRQFDYTTVEPPSYRPFLTEQYVSMGLKKCSRNDWIEIDRNYKERIEYRQRILAEHDDRCIGCLTDANAVQAVRELWQTIVLSQLPLRFPEVFICQKNGSSFHNTITDTTFPTEPPSDVRTSYDALRILGQCCEEDFFLMCPDENEKYYLGAFVACFPNGFETANKLGMSLAKIHEAVPLYKEKIEHSVDRFFSGIRPNTFVQRYNWSITPCGADLFTPNGLNVRDAENDGTKTAPLEIDPAKDLYLRVERQIMTRLGESRAVVFTVKTCMVPVAQLREEVLGDDIMKAVGAMPEDFARYKGRERWIDPLTAYLSGCPGRCP